MTMTNNLPSKSRDEKIPQSVPNGPAGFEMVVMLVNGAVRAQREQNM